MKKIQASKILFIKLGYHGEFEDECINSGRLRIDFKEVNHRDCVAKAWGLVRRLFQKEGRKLQAISGFVRQLKQFYFEPEKTLWITFYDHKLWWCFADKEVKLLSDGTKIRKAINGWCDKDREGNTLSLESLSGRLSQTQGYQGTICKVREKDYCLRKINSEIPPKIKKIEKSLAQTEKDMMALIEDLHWKDFELLVDMIFRQAGWQRLGVLGKTTKSIDIELLSPVTGEKAIVQVKSQSDLRQFIEYQERFSRMKQYDKFFYFVHAPSDNLMKHEQLSTEAQVYLCFGRKLSKLVVNGGLVDWLMRKIF